MVRKFLLICGILAALLYVGSDVLAAMSWEGYSYLDRSVSELRAIGAPSRSFLIPILFVYNMLEIAFGVGVRAAAGPKLSLRIAGDLLLTLGLVDLMAPFFSLNLEKAAGALPNVLHVVLTFVTVLLILLIVAFGSIADGKWFRVYSYITLVVIIAAGALAFMYLPRIAAHLPTPWMGVQERINIYGYLLWIAMLAAVLLHNGRTTVQRTGLPPVIPTTSG